MRHLFLVALAFVSTIAFADADRFRNRRDEILALVASLPFMDCQILAIPSASDSRLSWVVWGEGKGPGQAVHLALYGQQRSGSVRLWSQTYPDAYQPTIRIADGWNYNGHPVLLLVFQYGAAAAQLDMYGLDAQGLPVKLDQAEAALFEFRYQQGGLLVLGHASLGDSAACYRFRSGHDGFARVECP